MKNLIKIGVNKLDELPINTLSFALTKKYQMDFWSKRHSNYHNVGDYFPYTIVKRIINKNIGKSFDLAFSHYCKLVPKYQQKWFLEEFGKRIIHRWRYRESYYIDENGLIQVNKVNKEYKPIIWYSKDYKIEEYNILNGFKIEESRCINYKTKVFECWGNIRKNKYWKDWYKLHKSNIGIRVVSGYSLEFKSKNDPKYIRLITEELKQKQISYEYSKSLKVLSDFEFRKILKEKELKERQENLVKIISHGFDPITSFRK